MKKVFIIQIQRRRDPITNQMVSVFDPTPAQKHGELIQVCPPSASGFAADALIAQLRSGLNAYDYARGDSIITSGDPSIIFMVGAVLGRMSQKLRVLRWDRMLKEYSVIEFTP